MFAPMEEVQPQARAEERKMDKRGRRSSANGCQLHWPTLLVTDCPVRGRQVGHAVSRKVCQCSEPCTCSGTLVQQRGCAIEGGNPQIWGRKVVSHFKGGAWAHGQSVPSSLVAMAVANLWVQEGTLPSCEDIASPQAKQALKPWFRHTIGIHPTYKHCTHIPAFLRLQILIHAMVRGFHLLLFFLWISSSGCASPCTSLHMERAKRASRDAWMSPCTARKHLFLIQGGGFGTSPCACIPFSILHKPSLAGAVQHTSRVEKKLLILFKSSTLSHFLGHGIAPSGCTSRLRSHMAHVLWNMDADAWAVCGILSLPHLLYVWLWTRPQDLRNVAERPVATFANLAYALKGVQFATVIYWWMQTQGNVFEWKDTNLLQVVLAAALLAIGQALNVGIYRAIGKPGVYYGCRLGESVPWHDGFPFNVVRHPQYVGAVLTVWGMVSLVFRTTHPGLLGVATFWTTLYTITALIEDYL